MNAVKRTIVRVMSKPMSPMFKQTFAMIGDECKVFYRKDGKEALPSISEVANKNAAEQAERLRQKTLFKNMKDIFEVYKLIDLTLGLGTEPVLLVSISDQ
jgi:hypothetical protein